MNQENDLMKIILAYAGTIVELCNTLEQPDLKPLDKEELATVQTIKAQASILIRAQQIAQGN
jgi:hypothetical protein